MSGPFQRPQGRRILVVQLVALSLEVSGSFFEVLKYRSPSQCERMACLSMQEDTCLDYLPGFKRLEKSCTDGQICTKCQYGNETHPTKCECENPPFTTLVEYGTPCNAASKCREGTCFRPCFTYLHVSECPNTHCVWNVTECQPRVTAPDPIHWKSVVKPIMSKPFDAQVGAVMEQTTPKHFPITYEDLLASSKGYRVEGILMSDLIHPEVLFLQLDRDNDRFLNKEEYDQLPGMLNLLQSMALEQLGAAETNLTENMTEERRRLQDDEQGTVGPEKCIEQVPKQYYCSFDQTCKDFCDECGWKTVPDPDFYACVQPSPEACHSWGKKEFCETLQVCVPDGDCSGCPDMPVTDHSQHKCLSPWWYPEPPELWTHWVCRHRKKNGMSCNHDQDCIYGTRRCLEGKCQPLQPYNASQKCEGDLDCGNIGYYCPEDATGDQNPYWVQYCRQQKKEGEMCLGDRECVPDHRCNMAESAPRCRKLFSLPLGEYASNQYLCTLGHTDKNERCSYPAKSLNLARSCTTNADCHTTDVTGKTGECVCKDWWEDDDSKYCMPLTGDFKNNAETIRDFLDFRAKNCGSFWTDEECEEEFGQSYRDVMREMMCEQQELTGGPFIPKPDCQITNPSYVDHCTWKVSGGATLARIPLTALAVLLLLRLGAAACPGA